MVCLPFPRKRKTLLSVVAARLPVDHRLPDGGGRCQRSEHALPPWLVNLILRCLLNLVRSAHGLTALRNANGDAGPLSPTPQNTQFALGLHSANAIVLINDRSELAGLGSLQQSPPRPNQRQSRVWSDRSSGR